MKFERLSAVAFACAASVGAAAGSKANVPHWDGSFAEKLDAARAAGRAAVLKADAEMNEKYK